MAEIAKMEEEMIGLERDLKGVGENFGENILNLQCARSYMKKLLENGRVVRLLSANHSGVLSEFEAIVRCWGCDGMRASMWPTTTRTGDLPTGPPFDGNGPQSL